MTSKKEVENRVSRRVGPLAAAVFCTVLLAQPMKAQDRSSRSTSGLSSAASAGPISAAVEQDQNATSAFPSIPLGTILALRLNTTLSFSKTKSGQMISARVMQTVPLSTGGHIPHGSRVLGHIVEVSAGSGGSPATISLQFDKLIVSGQTIPITTNLRAIAGFVAVDEAQTPTTPAGQGDNYNQLPTRQIGGDVVFGWGGPVTRGEDTGQVVGRAVTDGVLVQVSAKEGTKCRGALYGNDSPQALWVFSSDACGVYGIDHLQVSDAGRSKPVGVIILSSDTDKLKIRSGAGMLLRINEAGK